MDCFSVIIGRLCAGRTLGGGSKNTRTLHSPQRRHCKTSGIRARGNFVSLVQISVVMSSWNRVWHQANRAALPAHSPCIHVMLAPDTTVCSCCRGAMHVIGEDTAERLDVIPEPRNWGIRRRSKSSLRTPLFDAPAGLPCRVSGSAGKFIGRNMPAPSSG